MSWLGEQFTAITGKLSDFTKEVLIESSGIISSEGSGQNVTAPSQEHQGHEYSRETVLQLLHEKDSTIEQLAREKELYDRNIEELDEQHQEEVNQLLLQRSRLVKENHELKEKLKTLEVESKRGSEKLDPFSTANVHYNLFSESGNLCFATDKNNLACDYDKINLFNVLSCLQNCSDTRDVEELVSHLETKRSQLTQLLQRNHSTATSEHIQRTIENINIYISYLTYIASSGETFLPVLRENGLTLHLLHSRCVSLEENINTLKSEVVHLNDVIKCLSEKETDSNDNSITDSLSQIASEEISAAAQVPPIGGIHCSTAESRHSQTDSLLHSSSSENYTEHQEKIRKQPCHFSDIGVGTVCVTFESKHSQTDSSLDSSCCKKCAEHTEIINKQQCIINDCMQQIDLLKQEAHFHNCSVSVQTETEYLCKCVFLESELNKQRSKLSHLQAEVEEKEADLNLRLQNEMSCYSELLNQYKETEELLEDKKKTITDKDNEILLLKSKITELKASVNIAKAKECNKLVTGNTECNMEKMDVTCKTLSNNEYFRENVLNDCCVSLMDKISNSQYTHPSEIGDFNKLHEQLKMAELEKGRILCVLNEKTQECSRLKAEVHHLTTVVASEKQALLKLQQDNHQLKRIQQDSLDPELTKEALQNLSRIIRDKDIEIEALRQKNDSLSSLIQQPSSVSAEHLQAVMEECENLTMQLNICKTEQEKYMMSCNAKEQECQKYLAEVQRLTSLLSCQTEKFDVLQQQHHSVAQQYEEKRKSLINTQNEMIALKQRVTDLEQQQVEIKEKYSELLNKFNSDVLIQVHRDEYNGKLSEIENLKLVCKEKGDLIHEKDCIIHELSQQIKKQKNSFEEQEQAHLGLRRENSELITKLNEVENNVQKLLEDKESLKQHLNDKHAELVLQKEMNERLNMTISEKEFSIQSMGKKITSLSQIIQGNISSSSESPYNCDIDQILAESDLMYSQAEHFQRERDESLLSLSQSQHENQELKNEVQRLKSTEEHLKSELDRLRQHLLQIEENYTSEALKSEEREKELRNQLADLQNRCRAKNSAVIDASHEANIQVASLQEQLSMIANQRDRALAQVSALDDKVQQYVASLNNLQLVLDQMEKGHKQKLGDVEKRLFLQLEKEKEQCRRLEKELKMKQMQLEETSQALEAATRLSEQLDSREEVIAILRCELQKAEHKVRSVAEQMECIKSNTEGKVDRVVIKSLVLGYFSTPPGQKSEVVRLLARVLDFNQEEMEKAGIIVTRNRRNPEQRGLFSSLFGRLPTLVHSSPPRSLPPPPSSEKSFTSLFVEFLENESQPINPIPLPAEKMASEVTSKKSQSHKAQVPANTPVLLSLADSFPAFTPIPISDSSSPAPSILQEVLK